jgi:hypothetical protein
MSPPNHGAVPRAGWFGDPNASMEDRIKQVEGLIQQQKDHIARKEISDDFYYTRGGRDGDIWRLNQLQQVLKGLQEEVKRDTNTNTNTNHP